MLYTHATLGQVAIARVAEPAGRVNERGTERGEERKFTVGREPGNRSARWKFSRRHDSINNNRNTGQNDRSNNIVVENAGGSLRAHAHRVSKRRPRFDGGATTVLVDSIRHAARPLSPRHFCRCLLPPTTPKIPLSSIVRVANVHRPTTAAAVPVVASAIRPRPAIGRCGIDWPSCPSSERGTHTPTSVPFFVPSFSYFPLFLFFTSYLDLDDFCSGKMIYR